MTTESEEAADAIAKTLSKWANLQKELSELENQHLEYVALRDRLFKIQNENSKSVASQLKKVDQIKKLMKSCNGKTSSSNENLQRFRDMESDIIEAKTSLNDMTEELPRQNNGLYLSVILGNIDVSLLNKEEKYRYKNDYEKFKLTVTVIILVVLLLAFCIQKRAADAVCHFLLVWYYATLTIRESILIVNGSKIKGWWMVHHHASAVVAGVMLTWPLTPCYEAFRHQMGLFSIYVALVQLLQCQYQRGCLRRLHSLGHRHSMDITIDGFHSWMFKGLTFLLPFLVLGYAFQLHNAYTLLQIWRVNQCAEWQVLVLSGLFLMLAVGNSWTTGIVVWLKISERRSFGHRRELQTKYSVHVSPTTAHDIQKELRQDEGQKKDE